MPKYIRRILLIGKADWDNDIKRWTISEDDLDSIPVVDAEPVVHCADCVHLMFSDCYGECKRGYLGGIVRPDDYCSRGERKEDNT